LSLFDFSEHQQLGTALALSLSQACRLGNVKIDLRLFI